MWKTMLRGWLLKWILPEGATISFRPHEYPEPIDHYYTSPPENIDPSFLFGGSSGPQIGINKLFLSFNTGGDCAAGKETRIKEAKRTALANHERYGDITDRRDVFFENCERDGKSAVFPISTVE